jgi:pimeloyl-ACP methyl ester carboxylesterase
MRIVKILLITGLSVLLLAAGGFILWAETPSGPMPEALDALGSDANVTVTQDDWIVFKPEGSEPTSGLIIYPGGRIDPRSYAPAARAIAEQGYLVVIVPMPLNLAVFDSGAADDVIAAFPQIQHWAVGGHSLGGAMAAGYAANHPEAVDGLVLWAAYPADNVDLSSSAIRAASIYGSADALADEATILSTKPRLPGETHWVAIAGGNHAQFGWFGNQPGDGAATISRPEQQAQIIDATVELLQRLEG